MSFMNVTVLFFAQARERAGRSSTMLDLPDGSRVSDAIAALGRAHPDLDPLWPHLAVAVNGVLVAPDATLTPDTELALLPPVSGGSGATSFRFEPASAKRWSDVEKLFGPRGACAGCWCMWARLTHAEFEAGKGESNHRALEKIVGGGEPPGIIAYRGAEPVGWCALAPRETYRRFETSRALAPVDDRPVWSVVCFFIARDHRGQGLTVRLLREAVAFAKSRGATILEGYPVDPLSGKTAPAFAWTGLASAFQKAGFEEVARRTPSRPIMRFAIGGRPSGARKAQPPSTSTKGSKRSAPSTASAKKPSASSEKSRRSRG
jgi:molybdopterin converting factor small subunit/GNAT superfamily N-acetyltransferase